MGATGLTLAASDVRGVNGSTTATDGWLAAGGSSNIEKSRVTLPAPSLACSTTSMCGRENAVNQLRAVWTVTPNITAQVSGLPQRRRITPEVANRILLAAL